MNLQFDSHSKPVKDNRVILPERLVLSNGCIPVDVVTVYLDFCYVFIEQ